MPRQSAGTSPTAAEVLDGLNQGLQLYLSPTQCKPVQWYAASSVFSGAFGFLQRARYANVVTSATTGYTPSSLRFTSLKFYAAPGTGNYLLGDIDSEGWSFDTGNTYAATLRFAPGSMPQYLPGVNLTGPWSREVLENIVYEMNGSVKQTGGPGVNALPIQNWGLNTPDVSPQVVISTGNSEAITSIVRLNNTVTVTLAGALPVPGGNGIGMINVKNTVDLGFVGTFVVLTGAGTATLTWFQEGLNTSTTGGTVDTDILKSVGRSYSYAWENSAKPDISAPSPSTQFIAYSNQNGVIQLIEQGTVAVVNLSEAVTGTGTAFTAAWVGRNIWIQSTTGPQLYTIAAVTDATHLILEEPWQGATGGPLVFQIYDYDVTDIRLYMTADGGATYFEVQRNAFVPTNGTLIGSGLQFFDNANAEPPAFPFTTEISQLNNLPPPIGAFVKEYQGVLIVYGGTIPGQSFFYSNQTLTTVGLQQESFAPLNQITLPIQNANINGMVELPGALIIWSDKQDMFRLSGLLTDNTAATASQQGATITALPYNLGCASPFAVALTPLGVIWVTSNAEVWLFTDSYAPRNIGQPIQSILSAIPPANLNQCRMTYYHTYNRNWVLLSVPVAGTSLNNQILALDLDLLSSHGSPSYFVFDMASNQPVWFPLDVPASAPVVSAPLKDGLGPFDKAVGAIGTGTTLTTPSATPANANSWALFITSQFGLTPTPAAGWTVYDLHSPGSEFGQVVSGAIAGSATNTASFPWATALLLFELFGAAQPTLVQAATVVSGSVSAGTYTGSFTAPVTAGNTVVIILASNGFSGFGSSDIAASAAGYTFTQVIREDNVNAGVAVTLAQNAPGGNTSFNIVTDANTNGAALYMLEIGGGTGGTPVLGPTGPGAVPLETVFETNGIVRAEAGSFDIITDLDYRIGSGTEIAVPGATITTHAWGNDSPFIIKRPKFFRFNTNRDPAVLADETIVGIATIQRSLGTVTVTTEEAHGLVPGDWVFINTVSNPTFDGAFQVITTPSTTIATWYQVLPDAFSTGGVLESGWSFAVLGIDDDFYGFDNPLTLDLVPGINDTASLGGNPSQYTIGSPFRISQELFKVGGVNFVMGRRLQFVVNFPSQPGENYQFRSVQIGFGPSPPR